MNRFSDALAPAEQQKLARDAAVTLAAALAHQLHLPGARERHRAQLGRAIVLARSAVDHPAAEAPSIASARATLLAAHVARAQDARHGAGQLSLSAQRAPTRDDCDDGWRRVEAIVDVAEGAAVEATRVAKQLDTRAGWRAADQAQVAARQARRIVDQRNNAYTFHAAPSFSFGEGWYLAAAAAIASVAIQIEPNQPQTAQAERFLRDAGLCDRLVPYRPRPRANKHLPDLIARAFQHDAIAAQQAIRAAFLGDTPIPQPIVDWADRRLARAASGRKVLLWLRYGTYQPRRNTTYDELAQLAELANATGLVPILIGDALQGGDLPAGACDMTLFWRLPIFQGVAMRRAQLQLFDHLVRAHGVVGQIGVTTAGMDGPALLGLPTMYLTDAPNVRLGRWVGTVPGYDEIVRSRDYVACISHTLQRWAARDSGHPVTGERLPTRGS